ncbi:MAG: hypothetical protein IKL89_04250 [Clostridia bacterium]|nr:hypothetical protein [Clostridia bacterium]
MKALLRVPALLLILCLLAVSLCGCLSPAAIYGEILSRLSGEVGSPLIAAENLSETARESLSPARQELYDQVYAAALSGAECIYAPADALSGIGDVISCVLADHPELFWWGVTEGTEISYYSISTLAGEPYACNLIYNTPLSEIPSQYAEICRRADLFSAAASGASQWETALLLHDALIDSVSYDASLSDQSLAGILRTGRGICSGYARALQFLLQRAGIDALFVSGSARTDGKEYLHAWVMARLDGVWCHIDPTWADPLSGSPWHSYTYFGLTDGEISPDHTPDCPYDLPPTAGGADYFTRRGLLLSDHSISAEAAIFSRTLAAGEEVCRLRFASEESFNLACEELFSGEGMDAIFRTLTAAGHRLSGEYLYLTHESRHIIEVRFTRKS